MVETLSYDQLTVLEDALDVVQVDELVEDVYVFPLSFAQERLWFLDQFEPDSPYYNIPAAVRLTGDLDVEALEGALNEIVRRHESLRTTFATVDREPVQVISPSLTLPLPVVDLQDLSPGEREDEALRLAEEEAKRPFNLSEGPLLRAALLRLAEKEHIVLATMHHIVSDGWSVGVFIGELTALYQAFSQGQPSPLPDLPIQYADFAVWQREWLEGEVLDAQLEYWQQHLEGDPGILELPTDHPRPAVQANRGATESLQFSRELAEGLRSLGRRERTTPFMTLLAAFQTLLHRYSEQESINVGSPIANRNRAEIEGLIGIFINTLVMRADFGGDPTFRELLSRVRETTIEAYAHQDLPFETLVDSLELERDMSRTPLFQVMFILQNAPVQGQEMPGLRLEQLEVHPGTSTFDITLSMTEGPAGIDASVEYNTDLFEAGTIRRMLGHFEQLLEGIVADPDRRVSRLPLLTEVERTQLLVEWNDTAADYPLDHCIHELFESQVARAPDAVALVLPATGTEHPERQQMTYAQLNARANQLAHYLRKLGVGPETVVGVCVERSVEMIVGALGVLKAGGAYLPIDPMYPQERVAHMLVDSGVPVLLTQAHLMENLPAYQARLVRLDADWAEIACEPKTNLASGAAPENAVYMIYTSGSTGQSKGVVIQHQSLANAYHAWAQDYELERARVHLQMANFAFDVFSGDLVRALCSGGRLVICPREWLLDSEKLYGLMVDEGVDIAEFVPAVLRQLVGYLDETGQRLAFMKLLACGSDSWYAGEYRRFRRFCGDDTRLVNSFGLTEATIDSCYFESDDLTLSSDRMVPIGRPFGNMRLYVLDRAMQPVPVRVPGELHVGGLGVARGYHKRPELTEEKFVPDPFAELVEASSPAVLPPRLYKTGDLARYRPDGNIEFLGRLDHQVKIRGYRIELGEVEAVLGQHPGIRETVVVDVEMAAGDKRLAAYLVSMPEAEPTAGEMRRFVQERLPDYMVPSAYVTLNALPLTPNGKVDRGALPEPEWSRRQLEGEYVAPRTPVEEVLTGVFSEVLQLERVGVRDNFFELGGHSLLATQLVSRVREAFEIELALRKVFESPTVADLAEQVEVAQRAEAGVEVPPIEPLPRDAVTGLPVKAPPLSFAQQRLWFLDQLEPNSPFYNLPDAVRVHGSLDVDVLERALNEIVRRHEVLRTTFHTVEGRGVQVIDSELELSVPVTDLRHLPRAEREAEAERLTEEAMQRPFDLAQGPLLRVKLLRMGQEEYIVLMVAHHIISDDWSSNVMVRELGVLYDAFSKGQPSPLPELELQYADFSHWQRNWLQGEVLAKHLDYWKEKLSGSPPLLELPTDRPRPAVQTFRGEYRSFQLSRELSEKIKALSQREGATLFMTLLAAFQALLYRYTGQEDFNVGSPIANRNRGEIEGLIGFFVNTLVLRADLSEEPSFRELLRRVRETALGAYAHQDLPFETIVDALQPERNLSHSPLFQVMFVIQNAPMGAQRLPSITLSPVEAHSGTAKFDLTLFMVEGERLGGAVEYNSDLFDEETVERMMAHFQVLLEGIVAKPDRPVAELPILTEAERHQLLVGWNDTAAPYPEEACAHELFEAQAARTPDAVALSYGDRHLTYAELNGRANQLAHQLRKLGVGPETLVGICVERSPEMVVGILGTLKAGGAYVPIDPGYPSERVAYMLTDSGAPVLLIQEHLKSQIDKSANPQITHRTPRTTICLDADWDLIAQEPETDPVSGATPENLAYVIYTSGSTGRPKGAMVRHRGLVNYLTWCQRAYPVADGQGAPVHSSISFDLTITGLFAPLVAGRRVQVLPEDVGVETLTAALRDERDYSLVKITPAHLELLSQQLSPQEAGGRTRAFIIGGEQLLGEHVAFWQAHAPETMLVNEYGPTETVVGCCVYQVSVGERFEGAVPIGRPIINTQLYILDAHRQPVPVGVVGELYIGGAGVGRGYLNRPGLTAERFIPDPFAPSPARGGGREGAEARLYRTGDLCRYRPDGNIEFLGREDHQVKVRGFRIELGEIEAVLSGHPAVSESAVLAREDEPGRKRLVAYVVFETGETPGVGALRSYLGEMLPEYMVPSAFVALEEMPLTTNGKVDRRALPEPEVSREDLEAAYVAPRTPEEEVLAGVWRQVLGVEQVGVHDSFFELGGDSILSIQLVAAASQAGLRLTPRQIFEAPTIAGLAKVAGEGQVVQAEQGVVEGLVPLTPIQRWFFELGLPNPGHWNQAILLEIERPLEAEPLERALGHLLAHHDALRLRFEWDGSAWKQVNAGLDEDVPFERVDLSELLASDQKAAIETRAAELQSSLDLAAGPLVRMAYFDLGGDRPGRLLMVVHHLAIDGISWRVLLDELMVTYQQLSRGQAVQLPPKTTSFQHWAHRLIDYANSDRVREELSYWLDVIRDGETPLPVDYPGGENSEASARSVTLSLSAEETQALLQDVPATYRTEINDALLTALSQSAGRWVGRDSLLINLEGHGREDIFDDVDLSRTVGWFTTLFPVRLDVGDAVEPGEALMWVKEQLREIPRRGIGYGLLRYLDAREGSRRFYGGPQAEISFNYLGQMDQGLPQGVPFLPARESRGPDRDPNGERTHLLEVDGAVTGGRLQLEWTYSENLHRRSTIEKLAADYKEALLRLIEHSKVSDVIGFAPSDFAEFEWDQEDLTDIMSEISKAVE